MSATPARILTVFLGAGFLGYFLYLLGASNIWLDLKMIGWRLLAIVALEALIDLTSARAWWHMFPRNRRQGCFPRIWLVQLAGSAINNSTPGAPLGGEPIKAMFMKERFELPVTAATLLSAKLAQALGRLLFIMSGVITVAWSLKFERLPATSLAAGFILTTAGIATFMLLQLRGVSAPAQKIIHRLRLSQVRLERGIRALERVDQSLHELYGRRPLDFVAAVVLVLIGLSIGVVQVWLMLGWLGLHRDWLSSLAIESFSVMVSFAFFVVPGSLGVQEGGKLLIFAALGLPLSAGLSLGIAFRLSSLLSMAGGFAAFISLRQRDLSSQAG